MCHLAYRLHSGGCNDLDGAMELLKEGERIWRELGNLDGLQASLGGQANVLSDCGNFNGAMALFKEQEKICRKLGNQKDLAVSLINQAIAFYKKDESKNARSLANEAYLIASQYGYSTIAKDIDEIRKRIRWG